ncbi:hypothetical protein KEM48_004480 [Puccinia striiformis f. sp. tritici PST-130]|nr:hypothetical protein H4Q26_004238 [Puccinia striiformis f. sp. tritici PST-130]KAI9611736.1 hypothetical protein KEM48_004480 [Puccinia striiformis f. sp. tritici PST-130]
MMHHMDGRNPSGFITCFKPGKHAYSAPQPTDATAEDFLCNNRHDNTGKLTSLTQHLGQSPWCALMRSLKNNKLYLSSKA